MISAHELEIYERESTPHGSADIGGDASARKRSAYKWPAGVLLSDIKRRVASDIGCRTEAVGYAMKQNREMDATLRASILEALAEHGVVPK